MPVRLVVIETENGPLGRIEVGESISQPFRSKEHAIDILLKLSEYGALTGTQQKFLWFAIHDSVLPSSEDQVGTIVALPLTAMQYLEIAFSDLHRYFKDNGHDPNLN